MLENPGQRVNVNKRRCFYSASGFTYSPCICKFLHRFDPLYRGKASSRRLPNMAVIQFSRNPIIAELVYLESMKADTGGRIAVKRSSMFYGHSPAHMNVVC